MTAERLSAPAWGVAHSAIVMCMQALRRRTCYYISVGYILAMTSMLAMQFENCTMSLSMSHLVADILLAVLGNNLG